MQSKARLFRILLTLVLLASTGLVTSSPASATRWGHNRDQGTIVVANRDSGDISLIDVATDTETRLAMPEAANQSEPMYVVSARNKVLVGDRANNRVVAYDRRTWEVIGEVPTGEGVFHMWADPWGRELWVNNDIDNTITVINIRKLRVDATIDLPSDLVADGGKPHDVILDRRSAYVTMLGLSGETDVVLRYDRWRQKEVARADVGKDPHVTLDPWSRDLYVASQNSSEIAVLNRWNLKQTDLLSVPAAHGVDMSRNGRILYTTNITGGGKDALYTIDTRTNEVIGDPVGAPFATPHNIVLDRRNKKLYLTHSGSVSDDVSVFTVSRRNPEPVLLTTVTVGQNPFGIEFVR